MATNAGMIYPWQRPGQPRLCGESTLAQGTDLFLQLEGRFFLKNEEKLCLESPL